MQMTWEWIAGFFEGEGNIYWNPGKSTSSFAGRGVRVSIGQKDQRPLAAIQEFLLAEGFENPILYLRQNITKRVPNPIWILSLTRVADTERFLKAILPLVMQKQEQARQALNLQSQYRRNTRAVDVAKVTEMRNSGMTWAQIAASFNMGLKKVRSAMEAANLPVGHRKVDWELVKELRETGYSLKAIGRITGHDTRTLKSWRHKLGLTRTRTGEP